MTLITKCHVKMTHTCIYCQRSNIVNLSRHYGVCLHFDSYVRNMDRSSSPSKKSKKRKCIEQSPSSSSSVSSEQSSNNSPHDVNAQNKHLTESSYCNFSFNEDDNITSQEYSRFSDSSKSLSHDTSSLIPSSNINVDVNTTSSMVDQETHDSTSNILGINSQLYTHLLTTDIGSDITSNGDEDVNDYNTAHPDTSMLQNIDLHNLKHQSQFNTSQQSELRILHFLQKIKAPLYAYDELMKLLYDINLCGHVFDSHFTTQGCLIEKLNTRYDAHSTAPIVKTIQLESGNVIKVVTFDFLEMLRSLLTDPQCMSDGNLTFPDNDPLKCPRKDPVRNELHTGLWYKDAWKRRCTNENDFLLAIPIFIDSSNTDVFGKLKIEPVQFTLSIFNRECRRSFMFWRTLGFINDLSPHKLDQMVVDDGEAVKYPKPTPASNLHDYHRILSAIFESVKQVQDMGGFHFRLVYQNRVHEMVMKPVIGPIIGDNEGQDKLVARYQTYGKCNRLCHYCDISFENSDDPSYPYDYLKQEDIIELHKISNPKDAKFALNQISYHYVPNNVFHTLDLGGDPRGIHGICPAEVLHTLRLGIFKYAVTCLFDQELLVPTAKTKFDTLVKKMSTACHHQSDRDVPRTNFQSGVSSFSKITGNECSGVVLIVTMCMLCTEGRAILESCDISNS